MVNNLVGWLSSSSNSVQQAAHTVTRVKRRLGVVNRPPAVETPAAQRRVTDVLLASTLAQLASYRSGTSQEVSMQLFCVLLLARARARAPIAVTDSPMADRSRPAALDKGVQNGMAMHDAEKAVTTTSRGAGFCAVAPPPRNVANDSTGRRHS
eukprot:scaffold131694_cov66-Phaeocystis_antarctica.AAC.3